MQCNDINGSEKILDSVSCRLYFKINNRNTYLGVDSHVLSIYLCKRFKNGKIHVILGSLAASAAFEIR